MLQFVRRCAEHFLNSEQQEVRLEAVRTCSRLLRLAVDSSGSRRSQTVTATVRDVLARLLVVGITDSGIVYLSKFCSDYVMFMLELI